MKFKITDSWKAPETYSFTGDKGEKVTLQTYVLTLEDGRKVSVSKKPDFAGFEAGTEYDLEIIGPSTTGKTLKAKHLPSLLVCSNCGHQGSLSEFKQAKQ